MFKSSGQGQFEKLLEKATSNLLLEPDWTSIMMICDLIRQKDCLPKHAIPLIKKKIHHTNPHVSMFGLQVLESVVKNCGSPVHDEVATKSFMEELRELANTTHHENIREKILELILTWAHAFRKIPSYRAVQDVVNIMKAEGAAFKPLQESDAMFTADTAPEWADGDCCHRCRTEFGVINRKHHCRACGQIFCGKCSSKMCTLPKFGIEKEVRVCDSCFEKYGKVLRSGSGSGKRSKKDSSSKANESEQELWDQQILNEVLAASLADTQASSNVVSGGNSGTGGSSSRDAGKGKSEEELAEEEQFQLALAISQSEAEAKELETKRKNISSCVYNLDRLEEDRSTRFEKIPTKSQQTGGMESEDPELARYLNRSYWEKRDEGGKGKSSEKGGKGWGTYPPSAPIREKGQQAQLQQPQEIDAFVESFRSQIEMFRNRMMSNSSRGRPIAYDSSVQGLFMNITALHSQLLNFIQAQDNARTQYESLQDKLGQIQVARDALDALRQEHVEKLRRQAEEQERIRQYQMAQKLQMMRLKKQEYLQLQRQIAMQKMQEHEREMQMRIEQQTRQQQQQPPPPPLPQNPYGNFHQQFPTIPNAPGYVPPPGAIGPPTSAELGYMGPQPGGHMMAPHGPPHPYMASHPMAQPPPPQPQPHLPHQQPPQPQPHVPLTLDNTLPIKQDIQGGFVPQQQQPPSVVKTSQPMGGFSAGGHMAQPPPQQPMSVPPPQQPPPPIGQEDQPQQSLAMDVKMETANTQAPYIGGGQVGLPPNVSSDMTFNQPPTVSAAPPPPQPQQLQTQFSPQHQNSPPGVTKPTDQNPHTANVPVATNSNQSLESSQSGGGSVPPQQQQQQPPSIPVNQENNANSESVGHPDPNTGSLMKPMGASVESETSPQKPPENDETTTGEEQSEQLEKRDNDADRAACETSQQISPPESTSSQLISFE